MMKKESIRAGQLAGLLLLMFAALAPPARSDITISLPEVTGARFDTVAVVVVVDGLENAAGIQLGISYPAGALSLVEVSASALDGYSAGMPNDSLTNYVWWSVANPATLPDGSELCTLRFRILAEDGEQFVLDTGFCEFVDPEVNNIPYSTIPGSVTVEGELDVPPRSFHLLEPVQGSDLPSTEVLFAWEAAVDPNPLDTPHYDLWLSDYADLTDAVLLADSVEATQFQHQGLVDDHTYFWSVRATDDGNEGTWAADTSMFRTRIPDPPTPFALLEPEDGAVYDQTTGHAVLFRWQASSDPDPGQEVAYDLRCTARPVSGGEEESLLLAGISGTEALVDLPGEYGWESWPETLVEWWVEAISQGDTVSSQQSWQLRLEAFSEIGEEEGGIPHGFRLSPVFPNPFNDHATVTYSLPASGMTTLNLYNLSGQRIATLVRQWQPAGEHTFSMSAEHLASGTYLLVLSSDAQPSITRKCTVLR